MLPGFAVRLWTAAVIPDKVGSVRPNFLAAAFLAFALWTVMTGDADCVGVTLGRDIGRCSELFVTHLEAGLVVLCGCPL